MLSQPKWQNVPFPFFCTSPAFTEEQCAVLESLFLQAGEWQHRDAAFYKCSLWDVTQGVAPDFKLEILQRMRAITGLPLSNQIAVTAQRMLPGQSIGLHSDRPLLGYEIARLVVQLNRHWQPGHGGVLELFNGPEGEAAFSVQPGYNEAFGFVLHAGSFHAVTQVTQVRQSVVFNFWHSANTPELAEHLQMLFAKIDFAALPVMLDAIASEAESRLPEEVTFRAGTAAIALQRWGYDEETIVAGYLQSIGMSCCSTANKETYAAVLLAEWAAYLYRDCFDLARWIILRNALESVEMFARLTPIWRLCLPAEAPRP